MIEAAFKVNENTRVKHFIDELVKKSFKLFIIAHCKVLNKT